MSSTEPSPFGRRLIPQILDRLASERPDRIVYSVTGVIDDSYHLRHITAHLLAKAVDKTAWWLQSLIVPSSCIPPIGYIGPHDLRQILLTYACIKAGCAALFLSPKNNLTGTLAVLEAAECNIWVKPSKQQDLPLVETLLKHRDMRVLHLPDLDELLDAESTKPFPYIKTFEEVEREPFCILHTSGTTGVPKPISWSHGLIGTMDAIRLLPPVEGDNRLPPWTSMWQPGDTLYSSFPMSHGAGIIMNILMPSLFHMRCVLGPPDVLPNIGFIERLAETAHIDVWSMVPSLIDELGASPNVLAKLKPSKFICASGGPVSPDIACKVNETIRILNLTGTTEGLFIGNLVVERDDCLWFAFHPYAGFDFKEVEPGIYEHWIHRNEHWRLFQGIFHTFPDKLSINLKDLYVKHPSKSNLWAFKGRSDDVVVLSSGFKISPLSTEAYISTHPAVKGCLVVGNGKPQASLLIELKDTSSRNDQLFDSIWRTVEKANELSAQKLRLLRNYIAFAEPDKPFFFTDKGTVKRNATLVLYNEFIERFYSSRGECHEVFNVDTSSIESIMESLRMIFGSSFPAAYHALPDTDLFSLGLDSLFVIQAVDTIRTRMGLNERLAPRHLYANPTLTKFSSLLAHLASETASTGGTASAKRIDDSAAKLKAAIHQHKARLSFRLNPLDYVNPNHYMGMNLYFPVQKATNFQEAFRKLQAGLYRAMLLIPALNGKMMLCSEQEAGYKKGELCVTIPPHGSSALKACETVTPRQLVFRDLSDVLPSFEHMRDAGFLPSEVKDDLVLPCDPFPVYPADILVAQANFVEGGCILSINVHHGCLDMVGAMVALRVWAESCRYMEGDTAATCDWLHPESFNHSLPQILHEIEGKTRPIGEIDPGIWGFLPFLRPEGAHAEHVSESTVKGIRETNRSEKSSDEGLPVPPVWPYKLIWPPIPDTAGRSLRTAMILITPENVEKMKQEVALDPAAKGVITSISDIVQAFFWRVAIRARYRVATEIQGEVFEPDDTSILELPIDGRPYFSSSLPSSYMGSMLILNRPTMLLKTLCSPETSIGRIAYVLREAATRITPSLLSDAFNILSSLPGYDRFSLADMGLDSMHAMISNMILFRPSDISFGDAVFANGGSPEVLRPQIERGSSRFRFLVVLPLRSDGGIELALGTLPEELEMLKTDEEVMKYAQLVDY